MTARVGPPVRVCVLCKHHVRSPEELGVRAPASVVGSYTTWCLAAKVWINDARLRVNRAKLLIVPHTAHSVCVEMFELDPEKMKDPELAKLYYVRLLEAGDERDG